MPFSRYGLFHQHTLAWRLFKRHHTHFNDIFWSHKTAKVHAYSSTKSYAREDLTGSLFRLAVNNRRVPNTLGNWADAYSAFDQWTQMASIIAIAGYLETYIAQVSTAALESRPSLLFGGGPKVDGVVYLKTNDKYDLYKYTEPLVRGDWQARISAYARLFEHCPFEASIGSLEQLRKLRNDTGHSFGRDIESMSFAPTWLVQKLPSIKDEHIQKYLKTVDAVASVIESHLAPVVGQYEIIKVFHRWRLTPNAPLGDAKCLAKAFSLHINKLTGNPYGTIPAIELIKYYSSL
jgi:hypothetical protein